MSPNDISALYPQIGSTITEQIFYPNLHNDNGMSMASCIVYSLYTAGERERERAPAPWIITVRLSLLLLGLPSNIKLSDERK